MNALEATGLQALMRQTQGSPSVMVGLIDGPVELAHPFLAAVSAGSGENSQVDACSIPDSVSCQHGTFVAGMLFADRDSAIPGICPSCVLVTSPIFGERPDSRDAPAASMDELADAIVALTRRGVRLINVSAASVYPTTRAHYGLELALADAGKQGVLLVAAAGNQGAIGTSAFSRHESVIPVVACDLAGSPLPGSNLGLSLARRGTAAPGHRIAGLGPMGSIQTRSGTSIAAPFVTGALALLWSMFPGASSTQLRFALTFRASEHRRRSIVPPMMNAQRALAVLVKMKL